MTYVLRDTQPATCDLVDLGTDLAGLQKDGVGSESAVARRETTEMLRKAGQLRVGAATQPTDNCSRVEYAKDSIEQLAEDAIHARHSGTIGVEMSVKDGKLGKVKQVNIVFQPE